MSCHPGLHLPFSLQWRPSPPRQDSGALSCSLPALWSIFELASCAPPPSVIQYWSSPMHPCLKWPPPLQAFVGFNGCSLVVRGKFIVPSFGLLVSTSAI